MKNEKNHPFQKRITYRGQLSELLKQVTDDYDFGNYQSYEIVAVGYEDFNVILKTSKGKFFLKFFADFRNKAGCQRCVDVILAVIKQGVNHPRLFKSNRGYLHEIKIKDKLVRLIAIEYIDGKTFFDLKQKPSLSEMEFLTEQASLINGIDIKPAYFYDNWAIVNFIKEYNQIKRFLNDSDIKLLESLTKEFYKINLKTLPHCFVHGDIIDTNVIRSNTGELHIIDFSVSNYYPRIQELAMLLCDILFDSNEKNFKEIYARTLNTYQEKIKLEEQELKLLPLFIKVAHAMHIVGPVKFTTENKNSKENDHWLKSGRAGLKFMNNLKL